MTPFPSAPVPERYAAFRALVRRHFSPSTQGEIDRALSLAVERMASRTRYDGSPLMDHAVATAAIVVDEIGLGRRSVLATLLHDVVRIAHTEGTAEEAAALLESIAATFGREVAEVTRALADISGIRARVAGEPKPSTREDERRMKMQADNLRDLIVSYSTDPRVLLIKLADRLEVMRSLAMFPRAKRQKKSWESLNLYAQIAHKLGLYGIKSEMEDIALDYLEPDEARAIRRRLEETAPERERFIARFLEPVVEKLDRTSIRYHIKSRTKSVFSIWNKMRRARIPFEEVYDIFALRIIIDCPPEQEKPLCWSVYSIVTDFYTPNPERMRDWISIPKSNGYESLHTTVVAGDGRWVEVQIRSERMDAIAERGIAAHWRYKGVEAGGLTSAQWLARLRELIEETPHDLVERFDARPASGEIFVFTPRGDLRKLPERATVLDFAFDIHSGIGATCAGARVNQRNVSIREVLHNGDIVEIQTRKDQTPKADWLAYVTTSKARNRIRAYLREERAKNARLGREELERKIRNWKLGIAIDDAVAVLGKHYRIRTGLELYGRIVEGKIDMAEVKEVLQRRSTSEPAVEERRAAEPVAAESRPKACAPTEALVIDESIRSMEYMLARCCNPIRGDGIFGFVTVGGGVTIHRTDCPNAQRLRERYPYRVLEARWRESITEGSFRASIRIVAEDTTGMVNRIAEVINRDLGLNIRSMSLTSAAGSLSGIVNVEVPGTGAVDTVLHHILRIKGVQRAYRVSQTS